MAPLVHPHCGWMIVNSWRGRQQKVHLFKLGLYWEYKTFSEHFKVKFSHFSNSNNYEIQHIDISLPWCGELVCKITVQKIFYLLSPEKPYISDFSSIRNKQNKKEVVQWSNLNFRLIPIKVLNSGRTISWCKNTLCSKNYSIIVTCSAFEDRSRNAKSIWNINQMQIEHTR